MKTAREGGQKVVYCDEVMFTKHTGKVRDWSAKGHNTSVGETNYYTDYKAVVAGISSEVGVEVVFISERAITQETFVEFLEELRKRNGDQKLLLYFDNLSVHKADSVSAAMGRLKIEPIWNAVYSP